MVARLGELAVEASRPASGGRSLRRAPPRPAPQGPARRAVQGRDAVRIGLEKLGRRAPRRSRLDSLAARWSRSRRSAGAGPSSLCPRLDGQAPIVQWPRTSPFQGGNTGSNPVGGALFPQCLAPDFRCDLRNSAVDVNAKGVSSQTTPRNELQARVVGRETPGGLQSVRVRKWRASSRSHSPSSGWSAITEQTSTAGIDGVANRTGRGPVSGTAIQGGALHRGEPARVKLLHRAAAHKAHRPHEILRRIASILSTPAWPPTARP